MAVLPRLPFARACADAAAGVPWLPSSSVEIWRIVCVEMQ